MQEQIDNVIRKMEILKKKQMLEIKTTVLEMKDAFDGYISRLYTAQKRTYELEDMTIETAKWKAERRMTEIKTTI